MKTIKTITLTGFILTIFLFVSCSERKEVQVESPNGLYEFTCNLDEEANELNYSISFRGKEVIHASRLGFAFSEEGEEHHDIIFKDVARKNVI